MEADARLKVRLARAATGDDARATVVQLGAILRPASTRDRADAAVEAVAQALADDPVLAGRLRDRVRRALGATRLVHALAESGIIADKGLLPALVGRLGERLLPLPARPDDVRHLIRGAFCERGDARWVA